MCTTRAAMACAASTRSLQRHVIAFISSLTVAQRVNAVQARPTTHVVGCAATARDSLARRVPHADSTTAPSASTAVARGAAAPRSAMVRAR